jgi:hypothetical protein
MDDQQNHARVGASLSGVVQGTGERMSPKHPQGFCQTSFMAESLVTGTQQTHLERHPPLSFQSINHIREEIICPLINKPCLNEFRPFVRACIGMMFSPSLEIFTLRDLEIFLVVSASVSYLLFN